MYLSSDQSLDNIIDEITLSQYENEAIFSSEITEWGISYYVQVIAFLDGELIGEPSNIYMISTPLKPGSQDQVVFTIDNSGNLLLPNFQITNTVMNATEYLLILSTESDMSDIFYEISMEENIILVRRITPDTSLITDCNAV